MASQCSVIYVRQLVVNSLLILSAAQLIQDLLCMQDSDALYSSFPMQSANISLATTGLNSLD